jgi:ABC-type amino acid transport substrate-binding protein
MTDEFGELKNDLVVLLGPYHQERWTIARNTKRLKTLPNLAPLMYHKVGVEVDSVPDFTLTGSFGGRMVNSVVHYMSVLDAVDALQTGKIAAVAGMRGPIEWRLSNSKNVEKTSVSIAVEDDSIVQWPRRAWDIGVAIKHTYRQLGYALEGEIEALVKSGEIKTIFEQHGMTYELPQYHQSNQL